MNTELDALTKPELLRRIVEAERPCSGCLGSGSVGVQMEEFGDRVAIENVSLIPCTQCSGTGKGPILDPKLMRLPCPHGRHAACHSPSQPQNTCPEHLNVHHCFECHGEFWVPNPDPWAMVKALHKADFQLIERHSYRGDFQAGCYPRGPGSALYPAVEYIWDLGGYIWDPDPERARLLAVARAVSLEEEETGPAII